MKKRNREKVAKAFALLIVIIMLLQVFLPLFDSINLNQQSAAASVTNDAVTSSMTKSATTVETSTPAETTSINPTTSTPASTQPAENTK